MQLKNKPKSIQHALSMATCSLLSSVTSTTSDAADTDNSESKWLFDSALLHYQEKDRVRVIEPVVSLTRFYGDLDSFEFSLVFDAMSGATPNGATESNKAQVFTGVSGNEGYTTPAYETPTRDFSDKRVAFNLLWANTMSRLSRNQLGAYLSVESDYGSLGGNGVFSWEHPNRLTTFTFGAALTVDLIKPNGGKPEPLSNINDPASNQQFRSRDDDEEDDDDEYEDFEEKYIADLLIGLTQIINHRTLMQLNYSHAYQTGYLTDPYKIVSVVDAQTGENIPTPGAVEGANVYLYENRPDRRNINSLFWKTIVHLRKDSVRLSYRYFWDSWDIKSHTADLRYRIELGAGYFLQPRYRYYQQSAASFYRHSITGVERLNISHVSADYRLGDMNSQTIGLKFGKIFKSGGNVSIRLEQIVQSGDSHPDDAIGVQKQFDLFPTVEAITIQFTFAKRF